MASKRQAKRRMCRGKKRHPTSQSAMHHRYLLSLKDHDPMNVYRCQLCGGWHVGHTRRKRRADFV